ncbi:hypothetical protein D3218_17415 [Aureimonas flava]|uniref:LysR substrate-binding domain-containing protein n=1 Tax=Aureimonas flava TaxID=2320271 RepID=A0A3A1WH58_9HYPH|nr:hypothetical protein [Aureimonas flava]RIX98163.1 hypothetical protein D3218_17415 [Aureimonas flava]
MRVGELGEAMIVDAGTAEEAERGAIGPCQRGIGTDRGGDVHLIAGGVAQYHVRPQDRPFRAARLGAVAQFVLLHGMEVRRLRVDNGDSLRDGCLARHGIMMRSILDMAVDLAAGRLEPVLPGWSGGAVPLLALFAKRHQQPRKLRTFLDAMSAAVRHRGVAASRRVAGGS